MARLRRIALLLLLTTAGASLLAGCPDKAPESKDHKGHDHKAGDGHDHTTTGAKP